MPLGNDHVMYHVIAPTRACDGGMTTDNRKSIDEVAQIVAASLGGNVAQGDANNYHPPPSPITQHASSRVMAPASLPERVLS